MFSKDHDYAAWRTAVETLLTPLARLMKPGQASLAIKGPASNHGAAADRLEAFARPMLLAAHWLASEAGPKENLSRAEISQWFREGLVAGTSPQGPEFWGFTANHHQHTVEMAAITLALQFARKDLWQPLSTAQRKQILHWLASIRGAGLHRNNHMMFNVMTVGFLNQEGAGLPADASTSRYLMDAVESMALGGGWFIDGMNETIDYYNAYAFHYYGPLWVHFYGRHDPARAERWKQWTAQFLKDYLYFFAADGENPPFGRSIPYRFAATAPFGAALMAGIQSAKAGEARRVCSQNLDFFLRHPIGQSQQALSLGWTDEFPGVAEPYSCAGSPYWAAKAFAPLLLESSHPFWTSPEVPLPSEKENFQHVIPSAGLLVRGHAGDVEIISNANGISVGNMKFGTFKWGKLSYRSGFGFENSPVENRYPMDAALTAEFEDGSIMGRHQYIPIAVEANHCASSYGLGDRFTQNHVSVETRLWFKQGWQLHWHRITAWKKAKLHLGTYSLPADKARPLQPKVEGDFGSAINASRGVALQILKGFNRIDPHASDPANRTHLLAHQSLFLAGSTDWLEGEHDLLALVWAGPARSEEASGWQVARGERDSVRMTHSRLGAWNVKAPGLTVE